MKWLPDLGREMDGKRWKNGKTGIWGKRRENWTGFGANFPFSRPLPVFLQTSVAIQTQEEDAEAM
jgi:hypothetical protein